MGFQIRTFIVVVAAMLTTLLAYEGFKSEQQKLYLSAAHLAEGFTVAGQVKAHIAMYYHMNGVMPSTNGELNLPPPKEYVGQALRRLTVSDGGVITMQYNQNSGVAFGKIILTPTVNRAMGIQWSCTTPSYENIQQIMPMCRYVN